MNIEQLTSDLTALEQMTDAELLEYFKDVLHITKPSKEMLLHPRGAAQAGSSSGAKKSVAAKVNKQANVQQAQLMLEKFKHLLKP